MTTTRGRPILLELKCTANFVAFKQTMSRQWTVPRWRTSLHAWSAWMRQLVVYIYVFCSHLIAFCPSKLFSVFVCVQDSLLATPIILDLVILTELCQRITFCTQDDPVFQSFHSVLSLLSFLCKAPLVPQGAPVVNAFFKQRSCIENVMRWVPVPLKKVISSLKLLNDIFEYFLQQTWRRRLSALFFSRSVGHVSVSLLRITCS